jgi:long-chain acyl-CoA synthetase
MNIFQAFRDSCSQHPEKICIKFKKGDAYEGLTYGALYQRVCVLRNVLIKEGVQPGHRVALLLTNSYHWPVAFFAAASVQAVAVPIDTQLPSDEIRAILTHSGAKMLLTEDRFDIALGAVLTWDTAVRILFVDRLESSFGERIKEGHVLLSAYPPSKLAALFYTSGTTQERKAVMLTHGNLLANAASIDKLGIIASDDTIMSLLPLYHTYPFMITCLVPFLKGACVCYAPSMAHQELFNGIRENKVTVFVGVPQLFSLIERSISDRIKKAGFIISWSTERLVDAGAGLSALTGRNISKEILKKVHAVFGGSLRLMTSGGAKLDPETARNFYRWGFRVIEGYGLTETSPVVTFSSPEARRFGSVGRPLPGVEVKIMGPNEEGAGEVAVRGDSVMLGYYRAPHLTAAVLRDGWFLTGDLGSIDKKGFLYLTGRSNELIVLPSGKKVNPEVVEAHYLKSPYLKEVCVLCAPDGPESGSLAAVIVPDEDLLRKHKHLNIHFKIKWELDASSQRLPPYQRIHGFVLTGEAMPRTRLGKLVRYKVEQKYAAGGFHQAPSVEKALESEKLSRFEELALNYISKIVKKEVRIDDHLELDLGLDSLGRIELLSALQDLVSVGIDDSLALDLFQSRTVRELITKARQALPEDVFSGSVKRDDTVFWPHVLLEPLSEESRKRLKLRFDGFDTLIAALEVLILKVFYRSVFSLRVEGKENIPKDGPFVIAPNHVSYLDAFYVLCAMPLSVVLRTYFVGFGAIFNHPLVAWAVRFHRLIPIDADLNLAEALKVCVALLRQGKSLVYFPEGQRSADGQLKEFRKGIGILLKETNVKVLPIYIKGAYEAWPRSRAFPLPANITVRIGAPLEPQELTSSAGEDPYLTAAAVLKSKVAALVNPL